MDLQLQDIIFLQWPYKIKIKSTDICHLNGVHPKNDGYLKFFEADMSMLDEVVPYFTVTDNNVSDFTVG